MEAKFEDFVGIFPNLFDKEFCDKVIEKFESADKQGFTKSRLDAESSPDVFKKDDALFTETQITTGIMDEENTKFNNVFWSVAYAKYSSEYGILKSYDDHSSPFSKVQRTRIGGGYHVWHAEDMTLGMSNRLLTWILYLNDVEEGGETELLYQHKRIKPEAGTLIIFPAGFTHTHRGNPPLSGAKYIMTGWVQL